MNEGPFSFSSFGDSSDCAMHRVPHLVQTTSSPPIHPPTHPPTHTGENAHASYLKIAGATVGSGIASLAFAVFSIFQYFLLAAYISQGGALLDGFVHLVPGLADLSLAPFMAPAAFTAAMAAFFVACNQRALENTNNAVVMGVVASFAALLFAGMGTVDPSLYSHVNLGELQDVVPVAMCALVFQNVVPVVAASLQFDRKKVSTFSSSSTSSSSSSSSSFNPSTHPLSPHR